jgi:geranylgeranyl diphosphate synthase type II
MNDLEKFNHYLSNLYKENNPFSNIVQYPLSAGGKRVRPMLLIKVFQDLFPNDEIDKILPIACAIEMIHTYSLVHDDLPAMDNDSLRRGKPTTHIAFGEAHAILVGDALLTDAFHEIAKSKLMCDQKIKIIKAVSLAAGNKGMVLGQFLDMQNKITKIEEVQEMHKLKTGLMIELAAKIAGIIDLRAVPLIKQFDLLGQWFQINDDILDQLESEEKLGKPKNSDLKNHKINYINLLGLEKTILLRDEICDKILNKFNWFNFPKTEKYIKELIKIKEGNE